VHRRARAGSPAVRHCPWRWLIKLVAAAMQHACDEVPQGGAAWLGWWPGWGGPRGWGSKNGAPLEVVRKELMLRRQVSHWSLRFVCLLRQRGGLGCFFLALHDSISGEAPKKLHVVKTLVKWMMTREIAKVLVTLQLFMSICHISRSWGF
jgi:hypothetical protein